MSERLLGSSPVSLSLSSRFAAAAEGEDEDLPPATSEPPSGHIQEMLASTMRQIEERKRQTEVMIVSGGEEKEGEEGCLLGFIVRMMYGLEIPVVCTVI